MAPALLLHYDEYHTPLDLVRSVLDSPLVLDVDLGGGSVAAPVAGVRLDAVDEFCERFVARAIKANAVYGGGYVLSAALSRPLLAELCVRMATAHGADLVVHGFAGNDQLRFEMGVMALAPELTVRSVASLLGSQTVRKADGYTVSENIWGRSVEAGPLGDPAARAPDIVFKWSPSSGDRARHDRVAIEFREGRPVALDEQPLGLAELIHALNARAGALGIGMVDTVEDGFVGLKSRAVYEAPAATVLVAAHRDLERVVCSRRENDFKAVVDRCWADLVYDGFWFDPVRTSLEAYVDEINARVTGTVELLLRAGSAQPVARRAVTSLYDEREAIYRAGQDFGVDGMHSTARLLSSPMRAATSREQGVVA